MSAGQVNNGVMHLIVVVDMQIPSHPIGQERRAYHSFTLQKHRPTSLYDSQAICRAF